MNPPLDPEHHRHRWMAAGLRRIASTHGITLPVDYSLRCAAAATAAGDPLGVSKLGAGIVIHTVPETATRLPVLIGYSDRAGCWDRLGTYFGPTSQAMDAGASWAGISQ